FCARNYGSSHFDY
nr:immunoglobulin heavy chain junction region [Mus musculus]